MTIHPDEAGAMLADVDGIVARVKQSRIYRISGEILMLWGALVAAANILLTLAPRWGGWGWVAISMLGVAASLMLLARRSSIGAQFPVRLVAAFALFYGFGWIWSHVLGDLGPRQQDAFWPSLFMFGYALAGLWFGAAFAAIGLSLTALILAGYFWSAAWFPLWLALVNGGGLMLCGYWMRRA